MFSKAKVGDRVWDFYCGWGSIVHVHDNPNRTGVEFRPDSMQDITIWVYPCGRASKENRNPRLFWDEIRLVPPKMPKRIVEKTIRVFMDAVEARLIAEKIAECGDHKVWSSRVKIWGNRAMVCDGTAVVAITYKDEE